MWTGMWIGLAVGSLRKFARRYQMSRVRTAKKVSRRRALENQKAECDQMNPKAECEQMEGAGMFGWWCDARERCLPQMWIPLSWIGEGEKGAQKKKAGPSLKSP